MSYEEPVLDELFFGSRGVSECERWGMMRGCPGCPVLLRGDCDNPDSQQYLESEHVDWFIS